MTKLLTGLIVYRERSIYVYNCARFCFQVANAEELGVYLDMMATLLDIQSKNAHTDNPGRTALMKESHEECIWVDLSAGLSLAQAVLGEQMGVRSDEFKAYTHRISELAKTSLGRKYVDQELLLSVSMDEWA